MQEAVIVKLKTGKNCTFPAAYYNESKVRDGLAELMLTRNVSPLLATRLAVLRRMGMNSGKALEKYMQEKSDTSENSNSWRWQFHVALSVKGTELDKEELANLADRFMQAFGYGKQPYLVYFHHDTDNNHVHILSTNINRFGCFINDSHDKNRMVHTIDRLLGITTEKQRERMFGFSFQTEGQFLNVARSCGFEPKREEEDEKVFYTFFRGGVPQMTIPMEQIISKCQSKTDEEDKQKREKRIKEIRAYFHKYRQESLKQEKQKHASTKKELKMSATLDNVAKLTHKDGTPLTELEQYQLRWFLSELKAKFGLDVHFQKDKDGVIRGYGLVDRMGKMAFDGSQVMKLAEIIAYSGKQMRWQNTTPLESRNTVPSPSQNAIAAPSQSSSQRKDSQTNIYENSQSNTYELLQTSTTQQAKPHRKGYEHDASLDEFNGIFSASVSRSADRDYVTIRWQDGSSDSKPVSEKQASWYAHAGSDAERQDIATKLALSAFSREVYNHVRDYYIDEYEKGHDVSALINFDKCSVCKLKDGSYGVRVFFNSVMAREIYRLSDEDTDAFLAASENPGKQRQMVNFLAMKYLREEESRRIKQDLRYDDIFDYDSRKEKSGLAKEIAKGVRSVERATPGTIAHTNAVSRQLSIAAYTLRSAFTAHGGSRYENRENELRKGRGYEDEIEAESQLSY